MQQSHATVHPTTHGWPRVKLAMHPYQPHPDSHAQAAATPLQVPTPPNQPHPPYTQRCPAAAHCHRYPFIAHRMQRVAAIGNDLQRGDRLPQLVHHPARRSHGLW